MKKSKFLFVNISYSTNYFRFFSKEERSSFKLNNSPDLQESLTKTVKKEGIFGKEILGQSQFMDAAECYDAEIIEDLGDSFKIKLFKDGHPQYGVVFKDTGE